MKNLRTLWRFCLVAAILFFASYPGIRAQEAVSTTSSTATTSSSSGTTTDVSQGTTSSPGNAPTSTAPATAVTGEPSGTGIFSKSPVKITATLLGGYDDNVNTAPGHKEGSSFTTGHVVASYDFGNPRLQLSLAATVGGTYYYERLASQNYDIDLLLGLEVRYKASPRLTLGSTILASYLTEPSFNYGVGVNTRHGNYLYTTDKFFASYEWTQRFSTRTSYTFGAVNYDNNSIGTFANRVDNTFGNEFHFQLVPTTSLVAEYRFQTINYSHEGEVVIPGMIVFNGMFVIIPPVRLHQDSTTQFALAGLDHTFNPRLTASLRGGAEFRSYNADGDRTGPYFEGTLNYILGKRASLTWTNRYGIEEPDVLNSQSRTTFRTGLETRYNLTSRISSNLAAYYEHSDYAAAVSSGVPSMPFTEDSVDFAIALRYAINRYFGVEARYNHSEISSDTASRVYARNRYSGGLSITF
jgi:hypothetical protein